MANLRQPFLLKSNGPTTIFGKLKIWKIAIANVVRWSMASQESLHMANHILHKYKQNKTLSPIFILLLHVKTVSPKR